MYTHPDLARLLAQAQNEEARSRTQRASAIGAAPLDGRVLVATRRDTRAPTPATVRGWRARRTGPAASAARTTNC